MPYCFWGSSIKFQGHTGWKIDDLNPIWVRLLGRSQLSNPSGLPCSENGLNPKCLNWQERDTISKAFSFLGMRFFKTKTKEFSRFWIFHFFLSLSIYYACFIFDSVKVKIKTSSEGQSCLLDNGKPWCRNKHIEYSRKIQSNIKVIIGIQK